MIDQFLGMIGRLESKATKDKKEILDKFITESGAYEFLFAIFEKKEFEKLKDNQAVKEGIKGSDAVWEKVFYLLEELYDEALLNETKKQKVGKIIRYVMGKVILESWDLGLVRNLLIIKDDLLKEENLVENWEVQLDDFFDNFKNKESSYFKDKIKLILKTDDWVGKDFSVMQINSLLEEIKNELCELGKNDLLDILELKKIESFTQIKEIFTMLSKTKVQDKEIQAYLNNLSDLFTEAELQEKREYLINKIKSIAADFYKWITKQHEKSLLDELNNRVIRSEKDKMNISKKIPSISGMVTVEEKEQLFKSILDEIKKLPLKKERKKHSYTAVKPDYRAKGEKEIEAIVEFEYKQEEGLVYKSETGLKPVITDKLNKIKEDLELRISLNEDFKEWLIKNPKFTMKITGEIAGPEGLGMLGKGNEFYLHGAVFFNKSDMTEVMSFVMLTELLRMKNNIRVDDWKKLIELYKELLNMFDDKENLIAQFKILEQDALMTEINGINIRPSEMLGDVDNRLGSYLENQQCA